MTITLAQLKQIMPHSGARAAMYLPALNEAMTEFHINTPKRQAAFLAQIAHESGSLRYTKEIADGSAYERRLDLGNISPGDGVRFKGRGLIQITGRNNYAQCSRALFGDDTLLQHPDLLEGVALASRSAAWFWHSRKLNDLADDGDFRMITKRVNGGFNGYKERERYYCMALLTLEGPV